jgi:hypothetical protein
MFFHYVWVGAWVGVKDQHSGTKDSNVIFFFLLCVKIWFEKVSFQLMHVVCVVLVVIIGLSLRLVITWIKGHGYE